jgi:glycine cleavage system transcriptional repressor
MTNWNMLTLVGEDRPGIVAGITDALFRRQWNLGEASMIRLGGNFTIMMMVSGDGDLYAELKQPAADMKLRIHVDPIVGKLHQHVAPNIQVRVAGADRAGIVAQVTGALMEVGFNILELESDVAGLQDKPVYIMNIQGFSEEPVESLQQAVATLVEQGMDVDVSPIETMVG